MEKNLKDFEQYLVREERAKGTIEKYLRDVRSFLTWGEGRELTKELTVGWKNYLIREEYSPASINSMLAALHAYLHFMKREDYKVKFLRVQRKIFRETNLELKRYEYQKLIDTARLQGKERLAILIETLGSTGIRVSEIQYLTVEAIIARRADISLKGKVRTILISGKLAKKLMLYAKRNGIFHGPIFLTKNGTNLSRKQIWAEMKALCKAAKVEAKKVFPHNLRHLFACIFYKACGDIVKLADVMGHSSIETTRIYLKTTGSEYQNWLDELCLVC